MEVNRLEAAFTRPSFRMYVDEVGNPGMRVQEASPERYLSLTGVIFALDHISEVIHPGLEALKFRYLPAHSSEKAVALHRKDLIHKSGVFLPLRDPDVCWSFDQDLLALLALGEYVMITVVIDKWAHGLRYGERANHPYHYSMTVLLERYAIWLSEQKAFGDVMAESRGRKEDELLKRVFRRLLLLGDQSVRADHFAWISSEELKLKPKTDNEAGLQVADIVAYPSYSAMLDTRTGRAPRICFGSKVCGVIEPKFRRDGRGRVDGVGRKWLPY